MTKHIQPDLMQRFLADEADLMEREAVTAHLARCEECSALLVEMTAEDDSLSLALSLDEAELAWADSVDLTQPVLRKLRPWYLEPALLGIALPLVLFAGFMLSLASRLISWTFGGGDGPIGLTVGAMRELIPALWKLNLYLGQGGLLRSLWPVVLLAGAVWLWRVRTKKEDKSHA